MVRLGKEFKEKNDEICADQLDNPDAVQKDVDVIQMKNSTDFLE